MKMLEKKFGCDYHTKKALYFNRWYSVFKFILKISPLFIFIWFLLPNYLVIGITMGVIALISWLGGVKMKSLRNINYYAAKQFRSDYSDELNKTFR